MPNPVSEQKNKASQLQSVHCDAIHVGMPKCGSTYLQQVGFALHPEINLIWEPGLSLFFELRDGIGKPAFDMRAFSDRFSQYVGNKQSCHPGKKTVVSFEGFCGYQTTNKNDRLLAKALFELVGTTTVVVVVREPYGLINSIWSQYIKEGGLLTLNRFLNCRDSPAQPTNPDENIFLRVQFDRYLGMLYEIFGREHVRVLFFEEMRSRFSEFMIDLYNAIGVAGDFSPPNQARWQSPNYLNANLFRLLNKTATTKRNKGLLPYRFYLAYRRWFAQKIFPSKWLNPRFKPNVKRFVPPERQQQIRASNRRLAEILNKDLTGLGYDF